MIFCSNRLVWIYFTSDIFIVQSQCRGNTVYPGHLWHPYITDHTSPTSACSIYSTPHPRFRQGLDGGTTVSGTLVAAARAGVSVFVTGGVGGVHRGGQHSMDVSADLTDLGRAPVCCVCAGVKSILDVGRTLEVLETQGASMGGEGEADPKY